MTVARLSQLYYLRCECQCDAARLAEVDHWLTVAPVAFRVPLAELQTIIAEKHRRCLHERDNLERFIAGISDPYIQRLFVARFVEGKNWPRIAMDLGGYAGEDGLKKTVYRYLEKYSENEK